MMYAQDETPAFRRRLWMILWFIVVVVVLWTLVWFVFLRKSAPKVSNLKGSNTSQNQSAGSNSSSNKTTTPSTPASSTTPNQQLANTGAGNVAIPFAAASIAGTALYYLRLRRKLLAE